MTDIEELQSALETVNRQIGELDSRIVRLVQLVEKHDRDIESLQTATGV